MNRKEYLHQWYIKNKEKRFTLNKDQTYKTENKYHKNNPWIRTLLRIKQRCENPNSTFYNYYGGRGIENHFKSYDEVKFLWIRDNASQMKKPSIDRIDSNGHYCLDNCRFIELSENTAKRNVERSSKPILQFDINNILLKEWNSITEASKKLNINRGNIGRVCREINKSAGGFIWRYK
jgi:hypothetical protein